MRVIKNKDHCNKYIIEKALNVCLFNAVILKLSLIINKYNYQHSCLQSFGLNY